MRRAPQDLSRARSERVAQMVAWATAEIPFYRTRFAGLASDVRGVEDLKRLPVMTRSDIRQNFPTRLLPDTVDFAALVESGDGTVIGSSGTSDERLQVVFDARRTTSPLSLPEFGIAGGLAKLRIAVFTTPICSGAICHMGGSSYEARLRGRQLVLNSSDRVMQLTRGELDNVLEEIERFQPTILQVDPVYGVALVRALQREGLPLPRVAAVRTTYEYCSLIHREIFQQALGVPVFSSYGATELGGGAAAFQCQQGYYHVWDDEFVFEFLDDDDHPVAPGEVGAVVVTALRNRFMPMIRYRIGDLGRPLDGTCDCPYAAWPRFIVEGRARDCLHDTSGKAVTTRSVDELVRGLRWIDFYQLQQRGARDYELLAVRREGESTDDEAIWRDRARDLLGADADLRVSYAREVPPQRSLKYQLTRVVSRE